VNTCSASGAGCAGRSGLHRWGRFLGVGALGLLVQLSVLGVLAGLGAHQSAATALAVEAAILNNYFWHERWTWRERRRHDDGGLTRLVHFNLATGAVSLVGNVAFTAVYSTALHVPLAVANLLAVVTLGALNFVLADRWIFIRRP
jgi:dolichol-phosphate mannosyltransferase